MEKPVRAVAWLQRKLDASTRFPIRQLNIFYCLLEMILRPRFIIFRTSSMDRRRVTRPTLNNDPAPIGRIKRLLMRR